MMSSKKKKGEGKSGESWEKGEEIFQGVILSDSFNFRFLPITLETPRALLPLVNVPLLDYTIEFLVEAGVQEIFVFCCAHADQIKNHLSQSKWTSSRSPCDVKTIVIEDCLSLGDALREIDRQSFLKNDFVLVSGDVVSNMKLEQVLQEHKDRRKKDKASLMTMVFKVANPGHRTRCQEEDLIVALDSTTGRILQCEKTANKKRFSFPLSLFSDNNNIQIRYDLLDCNICICSTTVPQLFTDNFDYQTRDDFVRGILVNEEIMGNQIHSFVISDKYAARVSNPYMYDTISKDILSRWAYPIVPDNSVFFMDYSYSFTRHNVYLDSELSLARDCKLEENLLISKGTSVGAGTVITNSVIGRNCVIGDFVQLDGVHLWDNVKVDDGCNISKSILCKNVHIKRNVTITAGSIISFNVVVGPDISFPPGVKITLKKQTEDDSDFGMDELSLVEKPTLEQQDEFNPEEVGVEGQGYIWRPVAEFDDEMEQTRDVWGVDRVSLSEEEVSSVSSEEETPPCSPPPEDSRLFYTEVLESIRHGVADHVDPENIILEINASKFAYNVTFHELNQAVVKSLLESSLHDVSLSKQDLSKNLKKAVDYLLPIISNYIKTSDGQRDALNASEEFFVQAMWAAPLCQTFLHLLYDKEILEEPIILQWYSRTHGEGEDSGFEPQRKQLRQQISRFITWLQEAEEESDDDDDDDDEEE
ncbi:translation initiation factor eIF-2B subunit epsilon-like [Orbicella faveolata]|uniref:translation initiation factor eIF-2B subunit epsilon-like n=1 Tax=Orbicella faveolata TaxID=48498 RepID=UPI0009E41584|nr:translation initiation factor eIF-2B subunit epsilon-like [Orbicella faveolata]